MGDTQRGGVALKNERQDAKMPRRKILFVFLLACPPRSLRLCVHPIFLNERKDAENAENGVNPSLAFLASWRSLVPVCIQTDGWGSLNGDPASPHGGIVIPPYELVLRRLDHK